jgi:hypothetical protein
VLGLAIYLFVVANNIERFSALWLVLAGLAIWSIAPPRDAYQIWFVSGALLLGTFGLFNAVAKARDWPASQMHQLAVLGDWARLPAIACWMVAVAIRIWYGSASQPGLRSRFRPPSSPAAPPP